jgi:hypothetical protein
MSVTYSKSIFVHIGDNDCGGGGVTETLLKHVSNRRTTTKVSDLNNNKILHTLQIKMSAAQDKQNEYSSKQAQFLS